MNENSKLKYYLLSWYNLYKKGHEICKEELKYKKENSLATLDTESIFIPKIFHEQNKRRKELYLQKTQKVKELNEKLIIRLQKVSAEANFDEETKKQIDKINEEYKNKNKKDNKFYIKSKIPMLLLRFIPIILALFSIIGIAIMAGNDEPDPILIALCVISFVLFLALEGISLFIEIKRNTLYKKYKADPGLNDERLRKIRELKKASTNHTVPDYVPNELMTFYVNYNEASQNKEVSRKVENYFNSFIYADFNKLIEETNKTITDYNDPEATKMARDLIAECVKCNNELRNEMRILNKPFDDCKKSLEEAIQQLRDIRTKLRNEFPLPLKYENEEAITCLLSLTLDGRCDTLKEAINLMEDEKFKSQMISSLQQINRNINMQNEILIKGFSTVIEQNNDINKQLAQIKSISVATFLEI